MSDRTGARRLLPTRFLAELTLLLGVLVATLAATDGGEPDDLSASPSSTATSEVPVMTASPVVTASPLATPPGTTALPVPPTPAGPVSQVEPSPAGRPTDVATPPLTPAAPMAAAVPRRLRIPSIGVDAELMGLGLQDDGTLEVPPSGFPAGWYTGAPTPGELGLAIIAGHVDWAGAPGVFYDLRGLDAGDGIEIARQDGSTAQFRVTRIERFAKTAFPTAAVYGDLDHAGLRLITCGGAFDPQARSYRDNLVVFAELVG